MWLSDRRQHRWRLFAFALIALIAAGGPGGPGGATEHERAGLEIVPARFEQDIDEASFRVTIALTNHDPTPMQVHLEATRLGHDLEGTPLFPEGGSPLTPEASEFVLTPGERREVDVRAEVPSGTGGLYGAIVATRGPVGSAEEITVVTRVASMFLVRGPRPWNESVRVTDVGIRPGPEESESVEVYATVENTGDVHVRPEGEVHIRQDGTLLTTVSLTGATILPGYGRRLVGSWTPPANLTGPVQLEAVIRNPGARGEGTARFDERGTPEVVAASIEDLRVHGERGGVATLRIVNTGTMPVSPLLTLAVTEGGFERAREALPQPTLAPGETAEVEWRAAMPPGTYHLDADLTFEGRPLDRASIGFEVPGGAASGWSLLPWIIAAALLLAAVASLALLLLRRRRRARRQETTRREDAPVGGVTANTDGGGVARRSGGTGRRPAGTLPAPRPAEPRRGRAPARR